MSQHDGYCFPGKQPDARLLLACLRPTVKSGDGAELAQLMGESSFNWKRLLLLADVHGLLGLLHKRLEPCGRELVPQEVREHLREHYEENRRRQMALTQTLIELLRLLDWREIPVIVFKGPLMARALYPDPAVRDIADLDLLVPPVEVLKVKAMLLEAGYQAEKSFTARQERDYLRFNSQYHFTHPSSGIPVEIHWRFFPSHCQDRLAAEVWARAQPIYLSGARALRLAPEDQFIYLCHHGRNHTWAILKFLGDLARIVASDQDLDWLEVVGRAKRLGMRDGVDEALYLLSAWLGMETPPPLRITATARRRLDARAALIRGRIFRERWGLPGYGEWLGYLENQAPNPFRASSSGDRCSSPGLAARYLGVVARKLIEDRNYLMPSIPPFLYPLRSVVWWTRHLCFSAIEALMGRG